VARNFQPRSAAGIPKGGARPGQVARQTLLPFGETAECLTRLIRCPGRRGEEEACELRRRSALVASDVTVRRGLKRLERRHRASGPALAQKTNFTGLLWQPLAFMNSDYEGNDFDWEREWKVRGSVTFTRIITHELASHRHPTGVRNVACL